MQKSQDIKSTNLLTPYAWAGNEKSSLSVLFIFAFFVIFINIWSGSLYPWDEAVYGEIAREIAEEKLGWLTLHLDYKPWFDKPPLFIWMIAIAFKIFGINEFAVRIWPALFGFGTVILLYFISRELFRSHRIAFFSSLTLLSFYEYTRQARIGMMDVPLTFFVLLGLFMFVAGIKRQWLYVFIGPAFAIAFMIKSFAVFPFVLVLILIIFLTGESKILLNRIFLSGIIIGILICLPWHIHQYMNYGMAFADGYILRHTISRTTEALEAHKGGLDYYFIEILLNKPAGLISLITFPYFTLLFIKEKDKRIKNSFIVVIISIAVILSFYTFVKTKLSWYIIPVYPFLAISTVICINQIFSRTKFDKDKITSLALIILFSIPIIKLIDSDKHRTLNYRPALKETSLLIKKYADQDDNVFFNDSEKGDKDIPVVRFYSKRTVGYIDLKNCNLDLPDPASFILIMRKENKCSDELKRSPFLSVLNENDIYIAFKKQFRNL